MLKNIILLLEEWKQKYYLKNNAANGIAKQYNAEGKLEYESMIVNGKREGLSKKYYPSGKLLSEVTFRMIKKKE